MPRKRAYAREQTVEDDVRRLQEHESESEKEESASHALQNARVERLLSAPQPLTGNRIDRSTILMLQRTAGNQAVQRLLQGKVQRGSSVHSSAHRQHRNAHSEHIQMRREEAEPGERNRAQTSPTPLRQAAGAGALQRTYAPFEEGFALPAFTRGISAPERGGEAAEQANNSQQSVMPALAAAPIQRGMASTIGSGIGSFMLRTVLGPFYKLYLYMRDRKSKPHKVAPNFTRYKAMLQNGGASAVATFGTGGTLAAALGMLSESFLDELSNFCSWATLISTLLGLIPGAQALLGVAAILGSITAVTMLTRLGISSLLSSWTTIRAKLLWDKLPEQVDPSSADLKSYLAVAQQFQMAGFGVVKGSAIIGLSGAAAGLGASGGSFNHFDSSAAQTAVMGKVSPNLNQGIGYGVNTIEHSSQLPAGNQVATSAMQNTTTAGALSVAGMREYGERSGKDKNIFTDKQDEADSMASTNQLGVSPDLIPKNKLPKPWSGAGFGGSMKAIIGTLGAVINPLNILIGALYAVYKIISTIGAIFSAIWSGIKRLGSRFSAWRGKKPAAQQKAEPQAEKDGGDENTVASMAELAELEPMDQMGQGSMQAVGVMEEASEQLKAVREMLSSKD